MVWGCQPWIKELPYANSAQRYNFRPGQSGKLVSEFWITPPLTTHPRKVRPARSSPICRKIHHRFIVGSS